MTQQAALSDTPTEPGADLPALVARANRDLAGASASDIVRWTVDRFGTDWCITSSMTDAVLPHLVSQIAPGIEVIFLDTGYHFAETIGTRDAVAATLPVTVRTVLPLTTVAEQDERFGPRLYERDPNACCAMRKVEPLERALAGRRAWATGLRRADSPDRQDAQAIEWDTKRNMVKVNPIVAWSDEQVDRYVAEHGVLINPLLTDGYGSIGCGPCTRRLLPGEDLRAGRWSGTSKTECGLHV